MTQAEIEAKLEALTREREKVLLEMQWQLGVIAGQEALLKELLAPPPTAPAASSE